MLPPNLRVLAVDAFQRPVPLRMPFRFGAVTMTGLTAVYLRVRFETSDGRRGEGVGASVLSPLWFDKDPARAGADKERALRTSMALAAQGYLGAGAHTAYDLHCGVQPSVRAACAARGIGALASSFGVALIDGGIVDGLCRLHAASFHAALAADLFGFGVVPDLPARPATTLAIRHTVGLVDPLVAADVTTPLDDGLPETLEDVIRTYGVHYFKIKIGAELDANLERLRAIASVLARVAEPGYRAVLDGNESFTDLQSFVAFVEALAADVRLADFRQRLLWIEQPVARDAALADGVEADLRRASALRPVILDESDGTDETVTRALALGYGGVSAKNCKGVFRTLHSVRVLAAHPGAILAAEDLTHPPLLPLHQDTAVACALGVAHAERNGHHYVRGLAFLPAAEQAAALREFPSLYERSERGLVRLRIVGGRIDTRELVAAGYGGLIDADVGGLPAIGL